MVENYRKEIYNATETILKSINPSHGVFSDKYFASKGNTYIVTNAYNTTTDDGMRFTVETLGPLKI